MLIHHLKIAWRNIIRNKFYSLILIIGFAIGIASSVLLLTYTFDELSYDNFHSKKDKVFLVGVENKNGEGESISGWTTPPTGPALKEYFHEIESYARICFWFDEVLASKEQQQFVEKKLLGADSSIFEIFEIPFISGDPKTALREPNSIVITEDIAKKYFGETNPIGKTLNFEQFFSECTITGVVENYPDNSHFDFEILVSLSSFKSIGFDFENSWGNHTFSTYVLLKENSSPDHLESRFPAFLKFNLEPYFLKSYNKSYEEISKTESYMLFLTPLEDIHLSTLVFENQEGKKTLTYALGIIGLIIIIMVCVNYLNLNIALSMKRIKETGIRKVSGSSKRMIIVQFLVESILTVLFALFIGMVLVEFLLPYFNSIAGKSLSFDYSNPIVVIGLLSIAVILGVSSGCYPAVLMSSYKPINALKGSSGLNTKRSLFSSVLIIFQFSICIFTIVGTAIVYKQVSFMSNRNLGFNKENILVVKRPFVLGGNHDVFKATLLENPDIINVSYTNTTPGRHFDGHGQHFSGDPVEKGHTIMPLVGDEDILELLDLDIIEGRGFTAEDKNVAILNESAVTKYNIDNPLDVIIDDGTIDKTQIDIIGIVKDFHFQTFHNKIEPLVIFKKQYDQENIHGADFLLIKMKGQNPSQVIDFVEQQWNKVTGNYLFEYSFLDQDFNKIFEREQITSKVFSIFSIISIIIACLGLLGIATFFAEKREKEIGIRKVNGAGIPHIISLLNVDFIKWLIISFIISTPLAWYATDLWLNNFEYKTNLSWWIFALGGLVTLFIALLTVSVQSYKAAAANPVESLKNE